jgi:hypothetical protein
LRQPARHIAAICCAFAFFAIPAARALAQRGGPVGSVSGTVIAGDTQQPARFVQVMLQSTSGGSPQERGFGGMVQSHTELDGTFFAGNVAPGDYYVTAWSPGYIPVRLMLQSGLDAGADPADLLRQIPVVHVSADTTSNVNVTMQRGGTLSGRIVWEDGSPAAGLAVTASNTAPEAATEATMPVELAAITSPASNTGALTDDRGNFRVTGLPNGSYVLEVTIEGRAQFGGFQRGGAQTSPIHVYGTGVFHKADAKPIPLRTGDERNDLRMVIDLHGLHTVTGHVLSATPGQSVASGRVSLADATDPALQLSGSIDAEGAFTVRYVPSGTYTLTVAGASTQASTGYRGRGGFIAGGTAFQPFSQSESVTDTDLSGLSLTLTPTQ